ncbi:Expansin [Parasponia andersonii]|uniref:Expansin n=1 Tax=Parasponia andersonii TaxID=3476 RepID=A0A2P5D2C0_PARAD|nr:Expansin [Parasponia andersonii]
MKCLNVDYNAGHNPCKANNEVVVTMVDLCPGCKGKHIDLSKHAFDSIAHLSAGRIKIDFELV